jgi:hypothetical protein
VTLGLEPGEAGSLRSELPMRLAALGIDTSAIAYRTHPRLRTASSPPLAATVLPNTISDAADTIVAGLRIWSTNGRCTLGFIADYNGSRSAITASHCTPQQFGYDGSSWYQPSGTTSTFLGSESLDPVGYTCGLNVCRASDAALITMSSSVASERGLLIRTTFRSRLYDGSVTVDPYNPYFVITSVENDDLYGGDEVNKMGHEEGWTWGFITNTCVDHQHGTFPGYLTTRCTYEADYRDGGGDSGGPVFGWDGGDAVRLLGVHIGGTTTSTSVFGKYHRIASDFGGTLVATRGFNLSTPSASGSVSVGNPSLTWANISGATHYQIYREVADHANSHYEDRRWYVSVAWNSFADINAPVNQYLGTTRPTNPNISYVGYRLYASGSKDVSNTSSTYYFKLNGPVQ